MEVTILAVCVTLFSVNLVFGETCEFEEQQQVCKICARGYYLSRSLCQQCLSHCQKCTSLNGCKDCNEFCISCAPMFVTCTSYFSCTNCSLGFYGESCNNTCSDGCRELNCDKQNCRCGCKEGRHVSGTACVNTDGKCSACNVTVSNKTIQCNKCPFACLSCEGENFDICTTCTRQHALRNGSCFPCANKCETCEFEEQQQVCKICARGYYLSRSLCQQCLSHCQKCTSLNDCKDCNEFCISCAPKCVTCTSYFSCTNCSLGFYGESCNNTCSDGCRELTCDKQNGRCGCKEGRHGQLCDKTCPVPCKSCLSDTLCNECKPGYFGQICERNCSVGCLNGLCDKNTTSECIQCKTNYVSKNCDPCPEGYFGENCQEECPASCRFCTSETNCTVCRSSFFGLTCEKKCSDRCADNGCERNTGKCLQCKPNFTGVSCENCSVGFEGQNCQGCVSGKYGFNCSDICPSKCKTNVCTQYNGTCLTGCIAGMFGSKCENICPVNCEQCTSNTSCQTCKTGYRGELCSLKCPNVCNGSCYHDGTCTACAKGYYGNSCSLPCPEHCNDGHCNRAGVCTECIEGYYGIWCENKVLQLGEFVALVVFVVLAVPVIVTVAVIIIKRKKLERCRTRDEELVMYSRMDMRHAEELQQEEVATQDSSQTGIVTIGSYLYKNIKGIPAQSVHTSMKTLNVFPPLDVELDDKEAYDEKEDDDVNIRPTSETVFSDVYTNAVEVKQRRIPLERLGDYVAQKSIEEISEEFVSLPSGLISSFFVSQREENKAKNRYRGLYPYDKNRVILRGGNSEYINASYIDGHKKRRAYIACIGPTEKHMKNFIPFWEMVWQENVNTIVMLTNLWEHGFAKCDKYWPDNGNTEQYSEIVVLGKVEDIFEEYVVRTFIVKKQKDTHVIRQIQFTVWPDKGVPARVSSIVRLQREVKQLKKESEAPVIVHCSAGIGRTGTFIALDILTEQGMIEGYVDIYACVRNLREERVNMIQTLPQYQYLYEAVVESLLSDKYTLTEEQEATYSNV